MTSPSAWWGRLRRRWARLVPRDCAAYTALSTRPVVLFVQDFGVGRRLFALLGSLRAWPVHVVYNTSWHVDEAIVLPEHLARIEALVLAHPSLRVTALAQTEAERTRFAARGVDTVHCNQGAFVDERVFRPLDDVERVHDAIYDARLDPFKRHRLASAVERLALVTYRNDDTDRLYEARIAREFAHASWCNGPPAARRLLGAEEVNRAYAACRVGLCLSAREGSMWASAQYLLAGLPIVSTPSEGGRDELFDPAHVEIVAPEPAAVVRGGVAGRSPAPHDRPDFGGTRATGGDGPARRVDPRGRGDRGPVARALTTGPPAAVRPSKRVGRRDVRMFGAVRVGGGGELIETGYTWGFARKRR